MQSLLKFFAALLLFVSIFFHVEKSKQNFKCFIMHLKPLFFIPFIMTFLTNYLISQEFCHTRIENIINELNTNPLIRSSNNNQYSIKVYFHVIRNSVGGGGFSFDDVQKGFRTLNNDFNPHNISFCWDKYIDYIHDSRFYNTPTYGAVFDNFGNIVTRPWIFDVNRHQDGIDIYLFKEHLGGGLIGTIDESIHNSSALMIGGSTQYGNVLDGKIISHEMGHVLFLHHTFHGTSPQTSGSCLELVNASNGEICGDFVKDTPANPCAFCPFDGNCNYTGNAKDSNGETYMPDLKNIMSYAGGACPLYFSLGQGLRMRNAIASLPHLQQRLSTCCLIQDYDLMVRDNIEDKGEEPNPSNKVMWDSPDIWVRNDIFIGNWLEHENPDYSAWGTESLVFVRVKNNNCFISPTGMKITLYWAKASAGLGYPKPWNGGVSNSSGTAKMGGIIGTQNLPIFQGNEEKIIQFFWKVPNPADYVNDNENWHFCLLARIEGVDDPITFPETNDLISNVRNNNNIAWRNITVVDVLPDNIVNPGGVVAITNPFDTPKFFKIEFDIPNDELGKPIYQESEVSVQMNDKLYESWINGGKESQYLSPTSIAKTKIITENHASLGRILLMPNQTTTLRINFNFLTKELTDKTNFKLHLKQIDQEFGNLIGGETFYINKAPRQGFKANAPDKDAILNESITLKATDINEPALYNWYNSAGEFVNVGPNLQIPSAYPETYNLEVISTVDGFKDYDIVNVMIKPGRINDITLNPTHNHAKIKFQIYNSYSAKILIYDIVRGNTVENFFNLNPQLEEVNLNISQYQTGLYSASLVVDGSIVDTKLFYKQ